MCECRYKWHNMYERGVSKNFFNLSVWCIDAILVNFKPNKITLQLYVHKHGRYVYSRTLITYNCNVKFTWVIFYILPWKTNNIYHSKAGIPLWNIFYLYFRLHSTFKMLFAGYFIYFFKSKSVKFNEKFPLLPAILKPSNFIPY
jgi:hypothetical protein